MVLVLVFWRSLSTVNRKELGISFSQKWGFSPISPRLSLFVLPSLTSLDLLRSSIGFLRSIFVPSTTSTFIFQTLALQLYPRPFSFIKYLPVPGWHMYGSSSSLHWLVDSFLHPLSHSEAVGQHMGCPMSHCACGGSQAADNIQAASGLDFPKNR